MGNKWWTIGATVLMALRTFATVPCSSLVNVAVGRQAEIRGSEGDILQTTLAFEELLLDVGFSGIENHTLLLNYDCETGPLNSTTSWNLDLGDNFYIQHIDVAVANFSELDYLELGLRRDCCNGTMLQDVCSQNCSPRRQVVATSLVHSPNRSVARVTCAGNDVISGRYLRLRVTSGSLTLCGVTVVGCLQEELGNLARGKSTQHSSNRSEGHDVHPAQLAVDGNRNGLFSGDSCTHTSERDPPHWWRVDLGGVVTISHVTIYNRGDCCGDRLRDFTVEVGQPSGDGGEDVDYALCSFFAGEASDGAVVNVSCQRPVCGRYLRVMKRDNDVEVLTLCEVEVFRAVPAAVNMTWQDPSLPTPTTATTPSQATATETAIRTTEGTLTTATVTETSSFSQTTQATSPTASTPPPTSAAITTPPTTLACTCRCVLQPPPSNASLQTALARLEEEVRGVKEDLLLDPAGTGKEIRKKLSAGDPRASSKATGVLAAVLLLGVALCIVLPDLLCLMAFLGRCLKRG